jgi:iron(III) transport system permease protein
MILTLLLVITAPVLAITGSGLLGLVQWLREPNNRFPEGLLFHYATGSFSVVLGSVLLALIWGFISAYFCARFDFRLKKATLFIAMLPLASPGYLVAYAWVDGLIEWGIPGSSLRTMPTACLVLGLTLVPYVYLPVFGSLCSIPKSLIEVGKLAGMGRLRCALFIELPLVYPAMVGSGLLVGMEVLGDFGTVDYLAIDTWSTGIYRSWYGHSNFARASLLALLLLCFSGSLLVLDFWIRRAKRVASSAKSSIPMPKTPLHGFPAAFVVSFVSLPAVLVSVVPIASLLFRFLDSTSLMPVDIKGLISASLNSFLLACGGATLVVACGILLAARTRWKPAPINKLIMRLAGLGYAIPGGVLAIGLLLLLTPSGLSGSVAGLLLAYLIRFLAIGSTTVSAAWERIPVSIEEQARVLGRSPIQTLQSVSLPLMRQSLGSVFVIAALDILKELPATMILRPFNFETLSLLTYNLASDERIAAASMPGLALMAMCLVTLVVAHWLGAFGFEKSSPMLPERDQLIEEYRR